MKVIILQGCSGSGKSHYARSIANEGDILSADDFFMQGGVYTFDRTKLSEAHACCFYKFIEKLRQGIAETVVVDNTNTTLEEISPYRLGAIAYGYKPILHRMEVHDVTAAFQRNQHEVPMDVVVRQNRLIEQMVVPVYWSSVILIPANFHQS